MMKTDQLYILCEKQKNSRILCEESSFLSTRAGYRGFVYSGRYSFVGDGTWIYNAIIGNFSVIEKRCQIGKTPIFKGIFSNHYFCLGEGGGFFEDPTYAKIKTGRFFYEKNPLVRIGNDVRICENVIVYSGVNIGDGAIIYPGSVIDSDVQPYTIVAGNPAKVVGKRFHESTEKIIKRSKWFYKDLSVVFEKGRKNYCNKDYYEQNLCSFDSLPILKNVCYEIDSRRAFVKQFDYKIAVVGPSHVSNWMNLIFQKEVPEVPFFLFGESGLSIHGNTFSSIVDLLITEHDMDLVLMVPDFRIGNASLVDGDGLSNALFIDPLIMGEKNDIKLYHLCLTILDNLIYKYGRKIRFIFWCLYGRERINKKNGKYITENGKYRHPVWNYADLKSRYCDNIIDISDLGDSILDITEPDGTIHPLPQGYEYLKNKIELACKSST